MGPRHATTEDRFRKLIEQSPNPVLIDSGGRIVYVNNATLRLFGATRAEQMTGRPALEFIHPDFHPVVKERIHPLTVDREPAEGVDEKWLRIDGKAIDVRVLASPMDWDGEPATHVTLRDITARKRTETWLSTLINATQDAVISIDRQSRIVVFNPAAEKMFGYGKTEVEGKKINALMGEPFASAHDGYIEHYEKTGEKRAIGQRRTVAGRRKNGETFPIELSLTEVATGQEVSYAAFIRDISEKVKHEHELAENGRLAAIGATVSKLLHELGSPLNGMYLSAQTLERRLASPGQLPDPGIAKAFDRVLGEIKRLNSMLSEFRAAARAPRYDFKPLSLEAIVREILALERAHYINKNILIDQSVPAALPPVLADGDKLKQVILNLCNNAVEAMPSGGTLSFYASSDDGHATIEIRDTGSGIPPGLDIWAPFVTTKKTGTGLGLKIVREIINAHRGKIDCRSEAGKGTTFRLTLPLCQQAEARHF